MNVAIFDAIAQIGIRRLRGAWRLLIPLIPALSYSLFYLARERTEALAPEGTRG
jgi:hypothetical protein